MFFIDTGPTAFAFIPSQTPALEIVLACTVPFITIDAALLITAPCAAAIAPPVLMPFRTIPTPAALAKTPLAFTAVPPHHEPFTVTVPVPLAVIALPVPAMILRALIVIDGSPPETAAVHFPDVAT